jgi:hypothetical protein
MKKRQCRRVRWLVEARVESKYLYKRGGIRIVQEAVHACTKAGAIRSVKRRSGVEDARWDARRR